MTCLPHQLWTFQGDGRPGMTPNCYCSLRQVIDILPCCINLHHTITVLHHSWILCPFCRPFGQTSMSRVPSLIEGSFAWLFASVICAMLVELRAYYFWHMPTDTVQPMT